MIFAKIRSTTQRRVAGGSRERLYALIVPAGFDHSDQIKTLQVVITSGAVRGRRSFNTSSRLTNASFKDEYLTAHGQKRLRSRRWASSRANLSFAICHSK
jgi:hypothetical protein